MVGLVARTALRETPEFVDAKRKREKYKDLNNNSANNFEEKISHKKSFALFAMESMWPMSFYFAYIYCGTILKHNFHYSAAEILQQNLYVGIVQVLNPIIFAFFSLKFHQLFLMKVKLFLASIIFIFTPYILNNATTGNSILLLQLCIIFFTPDSKPAAGVFFNHFPVFKRFTYSSFLYAMSRALNYFVISFALVYLSKYFGNYGILILMCVTVGLCYYRIRRFIYLEKKIGNYSLRI